MSALPVTHFLQLAFALFAIGLAGALLRRSLVVVLGSIHLMFGAVVLLLSAYARHQGAASGQAAAIVVSLAGLLELALAVAVARRASAGAPELLDDWTRGPEPEEPAP